MKFNRVFLACAVLLAPSANAGMPLTATGFGPHILKILSDDVQRIALAGAATSSAITTSTTNVVAAIHASGAEASKATLSAASKTTTDQLTSSQIQMKLEMDYKAQIEGQRQRELSKLISDESLATVKYIEEFLRKSDIKNLNITEAIAYSKNELDHKAVVVEASSLSIACKPDDSECKKLEKVGFEKAFAPSKHIEIYAEMCAVGKKRKVAKDIETRAHNRTNIESAKKTQTTLDATNTKETQTKRVLEVMANSCTPESVQRGLCGDVTKEEYVDLVLENKIIPNGGVSATNFYSPSSVGGAGIVDLDDPSLQKVVRIVEYDSLEKSDAGKKDLPPIVHTYRNSTQLKAAEAFAENIVNLDAIGNQQSSRRTEERSVGFQSMFMSRSAQLDLAKNTLDQSIAERRGQKLSSINTSSLKSGELVKEREDGAAPMDLRWHEVQEDMKKVSPENIANLTAMSDNQIWLEMYHAMVKKNISQFDRMVRLERQSLLLAALLSAEVNSPENIEYMKSKSK